LELQAAKKQKSSILGTFIQESLSSTASISADEDYQEAWGELGHISNYWQYLARKLSNLKTV